MTDADVPASISQWLDDADEGEIVIAFIDSPIDEAHPVEVWQAQVLDGATRPEALAKRVVELVQEQEPYTPFILDVKRTHFSWGADAATWQILVSFAAGVMVELTGPPLREAISDLFRKLSQGTEVPALEMEDAVSRARSAIAARYGGDNEDYHLLGEEEDQGRPRWVVRLQGDDGARYTVEVGVVDGLPGTQRIRRDA